MKMNSRDNVKEIRKKIWVAVFVERGFISIIKAYTDKEEAFRQEKIWLSTINPDYDEVGVKEVVIT